MQRKSLQIIAIIAIFLSSCQNKKQEKTAIVETPSISELEGKKCFMSAINKDTTRVSIQIDGDKITGDLVWLPYQKDKRVGTLVGTKNANGELELTYNFMQEGMSQTETKIMKIDNDVLLIKHGELEDPKNDGNMKYKDASKATFSEKIPKTECE
jgi:hypothetical protein